MKASPRIGAAMLALLAAASCGQNDEIAMGPLSGRIGGKPWTVATAVSEAGFSTAEQFAVTMYGDTFTACTGASSGGDRLLVTVPSAPGDYTLDLSPATFFVAMGNQNLITTWGHLKVDQVTATAITGGANIQFDQDNAVSGQFQITVCP